MKHSNSFSSMKWIAATSLAVAAALPSEARAQDFDTLLRRMQAEAAQMGQTMAQAQQDRVRQAMQNPQVRASHDRYVAQVRQSGGQPMDMAEYAHHFVYSTGFDDGRHMNRVKAGSWAAEQQARDEFFNNMKASCRTLMSQSTDSGKPLPLQGAHDGSDRRARPALPAACRTVSQGMAR